MRLECNRERGAWGSQARGSVRSAFDESVGHVRHTLLREPIHRDATVPHSQYEMN